MQVAWPYTTRRKFEMTADIETLAISKDVISPPQTTRDRPPSRIMGVDLARGVAIVGMMAIHILPAESGNSQSLSWTLFAGRSAALFALVAGISISFMTGGVKRPEPGRSFTLAVVPMLGRAAIITLIGLLLGEVTQSIAVILAYYGIMFVAMVPMVRRKPRTLVIAAAATAVIGPILLFLTQQVAPSYSLQDPSMTELLTHPELLALDLGVTGSYPVVIFLTYMIAGLAVGRLMTVRKPRFALRLTVGGLTLSVVAWFFSDFLLNLIGGPAGLAARTPSMSPRQVRDALIWGNDGGLPTDTWWWLVTRVPHTSTPLDELTTLGAAMFVLGLCLMLARTRILPRLSWLVAAGSMPLSIYATHVVITEVLMGHMSLTVMLVLQLAILLPLAAFWQRRFGQGPLEKPMASAARSLGRATRRRLEERSQVAQA